MKQFGKPESEIAYLTRKIQERTQEMRKSREMDRSIVTIISTEDPLTFHVRFSLPGFSTKDIDLTLEDSTLHLNAETNDNSVEDVEFEMELPRPALPLSITASYVNGMLNIKGQYKKQEKITIQITDEN